jgi:hypothetical protein
MRKYLVLVVLISLSGKFFAQKHFTIDECSFIEQKAFEIFPVRKVKRQVMFLNSDTNPFYIKYYNSNGEIKKIILNPGTEHKMVISQKQREPNGQLFDYEIIEEEFNNDGEIIYKKQTNKFKTSEEIIRFEYNNRTVSKKIVEVFKLDGGAKIQISTTTYNYNLKNQLVSKLIEYTNDFIKNHTKIYPDFGDPINRVVTYNYSDNSLIKEIKSADFTGRETDKINVFYQMITLKDGTNLLTEIKTLDMNGNDIGKKNYEYK